MNSVTTAPAAITTFNGVTSERRALGATACAAPSWAVELSKAEPDIRRESARARATRHRAATAARPTRGPKRGTAGCAPASRLRARHDSTRDQRIKKAAALSN